MAATKGIKDAATIRKTVRTVVRTLERRHPPIALKNGRSSIEQLIYCIAARNNPERRASLAIHDLKNGFAGWNEVRVSSVLEIADVLRQHDVVQPIQKSEQILRALGRTFSDQHKLKFEELTRERAEEIRVYMTRKLGLPSPVIADFLFSALNYGRVPVDEPVGRVLQRLGLVSNKLDFPRLEKIASDGLTAREAAHAYRVIEAHASETCTEKDPDCGHCPLFVSCPEGKARKEAAEAARLAPPPPPPAPKVEEAVVPAARPAKPLKASAPEKKTPAPAAKATRPSTTHTSAARSSAKPRRGTPGHRPDPGGRRR